MILPIKHISLKRKLFYGTLLVCLMVSLAISLYEAHSRQQWQKQQILNSFQSFEDGLLLEVSVAIWDYNWGMVRTIAESQTSQLFSFMKICDIEVTTCVEHGEENRQPFLDYRSTVHYRAPDLEPGVPIGTVYVQASYKGYLETLKEDLLHILLVNSLAVFGIAGLIFILFHQLAIKRLVRVERFTREVDLSRFERLQPLDLPKQGSSLDEIDRLADSVNGLVERVKDEFEHRQQLEKQLVQSQKMEALGTLAGGIAHDFNNILAAILGYAQLCAAGVEPGSKVHQRLEQIVSAGQRAKALISQILIFSRHTEANQESVQLSLVLTEALELIRASFPAHIQIKTDLDDSFWTLGDVTQLHQVMMNLAGNAGQAMAESGGTLLVRLQRETLAADKAAALGVEPGPYVCLLIQDEGPGISAEIADRIFEPFFTTKKVGKGTGMGLAVVHGIVQSHRGAIQLDRSFRWGARFRIYLPETPAGLEVEAHRKDEALGGSEHLLVVDDEPSVVDMGSDILRQLGYRVSACQHPQQALDMILAENDFDLLITDLTMPELSGTDLANKVFSVAPNLPVLLWTGYAEMEGAASLQVGGIRQVLQKPFSVEGLAAAVRQTLDTAFNSG